MCAAQGLGVGVFNEVLLHFSFRDIRQTENNTVDKRYLTRLRKKG